jgi:hypothetical protein
MYLGTDAGGYPKHKRSCWISWSCTSYGAMGRDSRDSVEKVPAISCFLDASRAHLTHLALSPSLAHWPSSVDEPLHRCTVAPLHQPPPLSPSCAMAVPAAVEVECMQVHSGDGEGEKYESATWGPEMLKCYAQSIQRQGEASGTLPRQLFFSNFSHSTSLALSLTHNFHSFPSHSPPISRSPTTLHASRLPSTLADESPLASFLGPLQTAKGTSTR